MNDMINKKEGNGTLVKRCEIFCKENIPAHIILKDDSWLNGYILEIKDNLIYFSDRVLGKIPILINDIKTFDFFRGPIESLSEENKK